MQIADWLGKLGLEQYAQRFSENEIDVSVLPHLTDQDLKDIGIPLGHRRKILAAINQGAGSIQLIKVASRVVEPKTQDAPERRFVTVLFSDLVGAGASRSRQDTKPSGASSKHCAAKRGGRRRRDPKASWPSV